jgi:LysM repeat protein
VSVKVPETTIGTITDMNGNYSIKLPNNAGYLSFAYIGCKTQTLPITSSVINAKMVDDKSLLEEVVVIGYGVNKDADFSDQLQGRVAGVRVGQKLKLTGDVPSKNNLSTSSKLKEKEREETAPDVYTVKSGDTLSNIASRYYLQLDYVTALNGLSRGSSVRVGQKLKLTGDVPKAESAKSENSKNSAKSTPSKNTEKYTVKAGESLNSIANRFGLSGRELAELNDLKANASLQRGQSILVPKTVTEYKVKRGDTLIGLASNIEYIPSRLGNCDTAITSSFVGLKKFINPFLFLSLTLNLKLLFKFLTSSTILNYQKKMKKFLILFLE